MAEPVEINVPEKVEEAVTELLRAADQVAVTQALKELVPEAVELLVERELLLEEAHLIFRRNRRFG